jgi:hypothetical protein
MKDALRDTKQLKVVYEVMLESLGLQCADCNQ